MKNNPTLLFVVAALLLREDGRFCVQKRPEGKAMAGLWEFPGGKVEPGETPEEALARELEEELAIRVAPRDMTPLCFASHPVGERHLLMPLYRIETWEGDAVSQEEAEIAWVTLDEFAKLPMPPADAPLVPLLAKLLG